MTDPIVRDIVDVLHTLVAGLPARSRHPAGPATGHLCKGSSWFPCVYERMLKWFPRLQVATARFSCSPPDLNFLDPYFLFMCAHNNHCHRVTAHLQLNILLLLLLLLLSTCLTRRIRCASLCYRRIYRLSDELLM